MPGIRELPPRNAAPSSDPSPALPPPAAAAAPLGLGLYISFSRGALFAAAAGLVALIVAGVMLPLTSQHAARHYWWVLAITPVAVVCLHPKIIEVGLNLALRVLRQPPLEELVSGAGMARALAWTALGWLCFGAHAWFLISVFAGASPHVFALSLGGYALAWSVGFLIVFFPGGIGPREIALVAVLAPVMSSASALVVALASRVVMTIGDLFWAGIGLAVGRARGSRRPVAAPDKQPSTAQGPTP